MKRCRCWSHYPEIPAVVNKTVTLDIDPRKDLAFHFVYENHQYRVRWIADLDIEEQLEYYNVELYDGQQCTLVYDRRTNKTWLLGSVWTLPA